MKYIRRSLIPFVSLSLSLGLISPGSSCAAPEVRQQLASKIVENAIKPKTSTVTTASTPKPLTAANASVPTEDIQRFALAIHLIKMFYIKDLDEHQLFDNALKGMLGQLDAHSAYLSKHELTDINTTTNGQLVGIGVELMSDLNNGLIKVVTAVDGSPAKKAGVLPGDVLVKINGTLIQNLSLKEVVDMIRGEEGTNVKMVLMRPAEKKMVDLQIPRQTIKLEPVVAKLINDQVAYLRISVFQGPVKQLLSDAVTKLKLQAKLHLKGVILDLRNNPGGLLDSACDVSNLFLDGSKITSKYGKTIVSTEGRTPGTSSKCVASGPDILGGIPMITLINEGTASAAEIVSAALQDYHRSVIAGVRSFGKGSVQTILPLDSGTAVKMTTALFYSPSHRAIQPAGVTPDVFVFPLKVKADTDKNAVTIDETSLQSHLEGKGVRDKTNDRSITEDVKLAQTDFVLDQAVKLIDALGVYSKL